MRVQMYGLRLCLWLCNRKIIALGGSDKVKGAQTLGSCGHGSREDTQTLSSRSRTNESDLSKSLVACRRSRAVFWGSLLTPQNGCPPQAVGGLPPLPRVDPRGKRSGEPVAILVVSTRRRQPARSRPPWSQVERFGAAHLAGVRASHGERLGWAETVVG